MKSLKYQLITRIAVLTFITMLPVVLFSQSDNNGEMPQYLFPEFSKCDIILKDGQVQTQVMNCHPSILSYKYLQMLQ